MSKLDTIHASATLAAFESFHRKVVSSKNKAATITKLTI